MKKAYSLKGKKSYTDVFTHGRKFRGRYFIVFLLKRGDAIKENNSGIRDIKIGISINRKLGKAHERNRIKRRIRAVCNNLKDDMNDKISIIIKPGPGSKESGFKDFENDLVSIFKNSGVINDNS